MVRSALTRCRRLAVALVAIVGLAAVGAGSLFAQATTLRVPLDQSKTIQIKDLKRVSVTNPRVADVVIVSPSELIVNGLTNGRTTMYLWDDKGRKEIQLVVMEDRADIPRLIREDVKKILSLDTVDVKVIQEGAQETCILRGVVDSDTQIEIVEELTKAYFRGTILNLLEAKAEYVSVEDQLRKMIEMPEVKVTVIYEGRRVFKRGEVPKVNAIILEGYVDDQRDFDRVKAIALSFSPNVVNLMEVVNPIQVLIQGHVLELSSNKDDGYGVTWGAGSPFTASAGSLTVPVAPVQNTLNFFENLYNSNRGDISTIGPKVNDRFTWPWEFENLNRVDPLMAQLRFSLQRGSARLLAAPKVVTRVDTDALIRVGGQIPVPGESQAGGVTVTYKTYGLEMKIRPSVDHKGNITSKVEITWTTLDYTKAIGNAIPLKERQSISEVTVSDGQHIIVSGLIQREEQRSLGGIPILRSIPILGNLFSSKAFADNQSELVVIITPNIVASEKSRKKFSPFIKESIGEVPGEGTEEEEVALASLSEMTPQQRKAFEQSAAEVDKTFARILSRDELMVTPMNLASIKVKRPSGLEAAAAGAGAEGPTSRVGARAMSVPGATGPLTLSQKARLAFGRTDLAPSSKDPTRRAAVESELRSRVAASRVEQGKPAPEVEALFPQGTSNEPLEQRLKSIITELPAAGGEGAAATVPAQASARPVAGPADESVAIDDRVDKLFLQIKQKLNTR